MDNQEQLEAILRKKGIGPEGSKSLGDDDLAKLDSLLKDLDISLTTQATMLTALLTLSPNADESRFIAEIRAQPNKFIREELQDFLNPSSSNRFQALINRTISKIDLNLQECDEAIRLLMDSQSPNYQKGAFLEAQRLKRESETENERFFLGLKNRTQSISVDLPELIDICDSYDGCKRNAPLSLFTSVVLGSIGFPTILHGTKRVAPKEGVTPHQILLAAGKNPLKSASEVCQNLQNSQVGWAYIDQQIFHPVLDSMIGMRKEMVKRPFLATFEKLLQPIRAHKNHIVTSFTHAHYKNEVMRLLKPIPTIDRVMHIKGIEGTTMPSLSRDSTMLIKNSKAVAETTISTDDYGIMNHDAKTNEFSASEVIQLGESALRGTPGFALDQIKYQASAILHHIGNLSPKESIQKVAGVIDSGQAWKNWKTAS